jgi:phosphoribosylaminoimidazolecarboxamide formyltransferase/IMP cyclohydrolase
MATETKQADSMLTQGESPKIRRALISVSDKTGLVEFARGLREANVEIYSTGGTRKHLDDAGIDVIDVAEYTGFPEMMDGRVKTLHPKIFAGILCRHDRADDLQSLKKHAILSFELVVVNLYPFAETIAKPNTTRNQAVEQIDIGGPSLVRAAAKNHAFVSIVTDANQYQEVLQQIVTDGCTNLETRKQLMSAAFEHTAGYDAVISNYFRSEHSDQLASAHENSGTPLPETIQLSLVKKEDLRYGENPHQAAAVYVQKNAAPSSLVHAKQLNGKELSYNNLLDLDSALAIVRSFARPAVSVMKHNNPCGAATDDSLALATEKAMQGDPLSAFGSVLGFNRTVDAASAEYLSTPGLFVEAIVAPGFDADAVKILTTKPKWKSNVRLLQLGDLKELGRVPQLRQIDGGMLVQEADTLLQDESQWQIVTELQPDASLWAELRFAWQIVRFVKSNAITLSKNCALCGVGAGQMSRVDSVEIAISKAAERSRGSILASDAFFPFPDSIHRAAAAGIAAIIQPGGSKKDPEVIAACNELGLPMILTGRRHFRH